MKIYNTLSRKKETFKPIHKNRVGLYTCGPTVYNYAHIGNLRTYIFEDILERTLKYNGYGVRRVMNITNVGHLTSDADSGEDKIEKRAKTEKKTPSQIATFYTRAFLNDIRKLNIKRPLILAPATKYIKEQQALIKELFKKGYAYETPAAIYFDVTKLKGYGKLSGQSLKEKITTARKEVVKDPLKKSAADFVLWFKLVGRFKNHIQRWQSPWGKGFPGWHIECSAISRKFLGQPFDIHTGGVDHIGTHHENEIAQSKAAYGKLLSKIWMHGEFLVINKKRMGKSKENFITVTDLEKHGIDPLAFRYFVLGAHYRSKLNFTWKAIKAAQNGLNNLRNAFIEFRNESRKEPRGIISSKEVIAAKKEFSNALNDDLNTPQALSVVWKVVKNKNLSARQKRTLLAIFEEVLGLNLQQFSSQHSNIAIPAKVKTLVDKRELFRCNKQFTQADALRKKIKRVGYEVEDTPFGPFVRKRG